jgi:hypothetical protein
MQHSPKDTCRLHDISRATMYRAICRLRGAFEAVGFGVSF